LNFSLKGDFSADAPSFVRLRVRPCKNTTENNNKCFPEEEIYEIASNIEFIMNILN